MTIQNVKLSAEEGARRAREILERGTMVPTIHAKLRMAQREFSWQDVIYLLKFGSYGMGYWNTEHENYRVLVKGHDLDGEELDVEIGLDIPACRIVVVTGMRYREKSK